MEVVRHLPNDPFMVAVGSSQYAIGFTKAGRPMKPHFPVPATMDNAVMALFCQPEVTRWSVAWFKRGLRDALRS